MSGPGEAPGQGEPKPARRFLPERHLAAAAMAIMCVITFANVLTRYLTNVSLAWTEEISIFLMVFMTLTASAAAFVLDRHIRVTILTDLLPRRARSAIGVLAGLASLVMFALLTWYGWRLAADDREFNVTSPALDIPNWLYTVWLPLLAALIALRVGHAIWLGLRRDRADGGAGRADGAAP